MKGTVPSRLEERAEKVREKARRYLDALGAGVRVNERRVPRGLMEPQPGDRWPCGCWVPRSFPLYRFVQPCARHQKAIGDHYPGKTCGEAP